MPPNPEKAARPPPHPAASSAHPRAEPEKPASDGAGVALAKKCPLHLNFPAVSLAGTARPRPPRLSSAALSALVPSFPAPCLPKAERKTHCQEGAVGAGAPSVPCPAVPSQPSPAPWTLKNHFSLSFSKKWAGHILDTTILVLGWKTDAG